MKPVCNHNDAAGLGIVEARENLAVEDAIDRFDFGIVHRVAKAQQVVRKNVVRPDSGDDAVDRGGENRSAVIGDKVADALTVFLQPR